mmetsp:Transcript_70404/g.153489  ORF Transcript_70404/g.153489 Transcript_70404/m.153489 type:complete len:563 (+) Transcript_70404:185-1873(+)
MSPNPSQEDLTAYEVRSWSTNELEVHSESVTIEEAIETVGIGRTQWILLVLCGLTFMSDAAEVTFLSFVTEQLKCDWGLTSSQETSIAQAVFVGMILGAPVWGWMADKVGRRMSFLLSSVVITGFGFGTCLCQNVPQLIGVRGVVGFGVAGLPVGFDILAEALPTEGRGKFLLYIEYFWTLGSLFVNACAWIFLESYGWQIFTALAAVPTLLSSVAGLFLLPESPRWLIEEGRDKEALTIVNQWATRNGSPHRFTSLIEPHREHHKVGGVKELCSSRGRLRRTTILMLMVWFGFGLSYYGIVSLLPRIFQAEASATETTTQMVVASTTAAALVEEPSLAAWPTIAPLPTMAPLPAFPTVAPLMALPTDAPAMATARRLEHAASCKASFDFKDISIASASEILGVLFAVAIIDRWGRCKTQGFFYALGAITAFILSFRSIDFTVLTVVSSVARLSQMAASCATWVHTPELFPTAVRAEAHALMNVMSKVGAFLSQYLVSDSFSQIACGLMMAAISLSAGISAMMLQETAGVDLADMSDVSSEEGDSDLGGDSSDEERESGRVE